MSRYDRDRDHRADQQRFRGDVLYEVWRNGGNPDQIDDDRLTDRYWDGQTSDEAAYGELRSQRPDLEP